MAIKIKRKSEDQPSTDPPSEPERRSPDGHKVTVTITFDPYTPGPTVGELEELRQRIRSVFVGWKLYLATGVKGIKTYSIDVE